MQWISVFGTELPIPLCPKLFVSWSDQDSYVETFSRIKFCKYPDLPNPRMEPLSDMTRWLLCISSSSLPFKQTTTPTWTLFRLSGNFPVHPDTLHIIRILCNAKYPEIIQPVLNLSQKLSGQHCWPALTGFFWLWRPSSQITFNCLTQASRRLYEIRQPTTSLCTISIFLL